MTSVQVRVLGPIEVCTGDGDQLGLSRRATRLILGILALDANRVVPLERLIDLLWADQPPQRARDTVYKRVSELRTSLSAAAAGQAEVTTGTGGYMLRIDPQAVDAARFKALVDQARAADSDEQAGHLLREAVGLWRGRVLGGWLPAHGHGVSQGLENARLAAWEDLFDVELRLANHHGVVGEILDVHGSAEMPSERLTGQAMLALYRTDRPADALMLYDRYWRQLRDDYGLNPGADLQRIHRGILNNDTDLLPDVTAATASSTASVAASGPPASVAAIGPAPNVARLIPAAAAAAGPFTPAPQTLPAAIADFTGRTKELAELVDVLRHRDGQGVRIAAVTGPGGVGKTALCLQVAHRLEEEFPDGQLYVDLRAEDGAPVSADVALGRFLRALGIDTPPAGTEARVDRYRSLLAGRRVLVVVDNAATAEQVTPLIPGSHHCAVLVNSRSRLGSVAGAHTIHLPVLDRDEGVSLLSRIAGAERIGVEPDAADTLIRLCGDLPLAIRVVGARLAAKPHWSLTRMVDRLADERERLRQLSFGQLDVRSTLALSYAGLPDPGRQLLRRLGDLGLSEVNVWTAAALLDLPVTDAEEVLEELFDAQLLDIAGREVTGHTRYRLHDLVRLFAGEYASADEDRATLEAARARAFGAWLHVTEAARQRLVGGAGLTVHSEAPRWPVDPNLVDRLVVDPLGWIELERHSVTGVVRRAADTGAFDAAWDLASGASVLFQAAALYDDGGEVLDAADPVLAAPGLERGRAALLYRKGIRLSDLLEFSASLETLDRAGSLFEQAGDRYGRALSVIVMGITLRWCDEPAAALRHTQDTLPDLRAAGDLLAESLALRSIGQAYMQLGQLDQADEAMTAALRAAEQAGSVRAEAQVLHWLGELRMQQGRHEEAGPLFRRVIDFGRRTREVYAIATGLVGLGLYHKAVDESQQARAAFAEALRILEGSYRGEVRLGPRIRAALAELDKQESVASGAAAGAAPGAADRARRTGLGN